jgi:hypothetical protein
MSFKIGYQELYPNYGFYIDKVPQEILDELKIQVDKLQNNFSKAIPVNYKLQGEIQHEYIIESSSKLKNYIKNLTQTLENPSKYIQTYYPDLPVLGIDDMWVNFQKKYEYNPIHNHTGIYSFVIWYQIPYLLEEELKFSSKSSIKEVSHGQFCFITENPNKKSLNRISSKPLNIDKTKEGYISMFPSSLAHLVYPFYSSDDYRITIAGNVIKYK